MADYATLLRDHVTLTCRSVDRISLQAYVPKLQSVGGVCQFLYWQKGFRSRRLRRSARSATPTSPRCTGGRRRCDPGACRFPPPASNPPSVDLALLRCLTAGGHLFCLTPRFKSFGNNQSSLLWGHANRHHLAARRRTGRGPSDRQTARVTMRFSRFDE
jgi:hypothetical protein